MTFDPSTYVDVTCATLPKDQCPTPIVIHLSMWTGYSKYIFRNFTTRSVSLRWHLTPVLLNRSTCVMLPKDHCIKIPWKYIKVYGYSNYVSTPLTKRAMIQWTLNDLDLHLCYVKVTCETQPKDYCVQLPKNISQHVDTVTLFSKALTKGQRHLLTFDPTSVEVTCVTLPKGHCVQVPRERVINFT